MSPLNDQKNEHENITDRQIDHELDNSLQQEYEISDNRSFFEELFDPLQHQQLQQQQLLEFQQRSKRKQVEQVLPLNDCTDFESCAPQSSASYIGQRLLALKQLQQKQHYEHQLQQQYENRSIIEEAYASDPPKLSLNEELEDYPLQNSNISNSFKISHVPDSSCDIDSDNSVKLKGRDVSLLKEDNADEKEFYSTLSMPIIEDGLFSEHGSNSENKNADMNINNSKELLAFTSVTSPQNISQNSVFDISNDFEIQRQFGNYKVSNIEQAKVDTLDFQSDQLIENNSNIFDSKESLTPTSLQKNKLKTDDDEADANLETARLLGEENLQVG